MYNYTVCGVEDTPKKKKKKVNPAIILQPYYAILAILKKILTNVSSTTISKILRSIESICMKIFTNFFTAIKLINCDRSTIKLILLVVQLKNDILLITTCHLRTFWKKIKKILLCL